MRAEDLKRVITTMGLVASNRKADLNMQRWPVQEDRYHCGTIHCFAGWYLIATELEKGAKLSAKMFPHDVDFGSGVMRMSEVLKVHLPEWADKNPLIWGNEYGCEIFQKRRAFRAKGRYNGAENLNDIVDHLTEVYERLKEKENES